MSDRDEMEVVNGLLRERLAECLYRLERLERTMFGVESGTTLARLPQILGPVDIDTAQEDIRRRIKVLEAAAERSE